MLMVAGRKQVWLRSSHSERSRSSAPVWQRNRTRTEPSRRASSSRVCATHDAHLDGLRDDRWVFGQKQGPLPRP